MEKEKLNQIISLLNSIFASPEYYNYDWNTFDNVLTQINNIIKGEDN